MIQKRNLIRILLTLVLLFNALYSNAQIYDNKYYLKAWGALGYASLLHSGIKEYQPMGGAGALLGLGFEYQHRRFLLSIGGEFDFKNSTSRFKKMVMDAGEIVIDETTGKPTVIGGFIDTDGGPVDNPLYGEPFVMRYKFKRYNDIYNIGYVNFPLQFGAKFNNGIYFLAGGKFGLFMFGSASTKAKFDTEGIYPQFSEPFKNMPEHYFGNNYKSKGKNDILFNYNIAATLEVGKIMFFNKKKTRFHYRIAGFVDYGILNVSPTDGGNVLIDVVPTGDFIMPPVSRDGSVSVLQLVHNSVLTSKTAINKAVNPFLIGVKLTLLFDLGNKEPCNCLEDWSSKWQKRNRMR
jgi:hypothetical protein